MSGGDGNGYNSGAHDTGGNINGGPTGIGGGGTNSGDGWHIDKDGTLHIDITEGNQTKPGPGKEGNGNGGSADGSSGYSVNLRKNPEALNNVAMAGFPVVGYMVEGVLGFTIAGSALMAVEKGMLSAILAFIGDISLLTGRVFAWTSLFMPTQIAPDPPLHAYIKDLDIVDKESPYSFVMLPTDVVTTVPADKIPGNKSVPAKVLAQAIIDEIEKSRPVAITPVEPTTVPVIKAQKTAKPNVYTAQVVPGMKPMQIKIDNSKPVKQAPTPVKPGSLPAPKQYISAPKEKDNISHHAIIDFGGDHAPVYVSVTKRVNPEEEKKQAEKARDQWAEENPGSVSKQLADINSQIKVQEKQLADKNQALKNKQTELQDVQKELLVKAKADKKRLEINTVINQINAEINHIKTKLGKLSENKSFYEKALAEIKEYENNPLQFTEKKLEKSRTLLAEKEKQFADKNQALKNKQTELQNVGKNFFPKARADKKRMEINTEINQLTTDLSRIQKELTEAINEEKRKANAVNEERIKANAIAEEKKQKAIAEEKKAINDIKSKISDALSGHDIIAIDANAMSVDDGNSMLSIQGEGLFSIPSPMNIALTNLSLTSQHEDDVRTGANTGVTEENDVIIDVLNITSVGNKQVIIATSVDDYVSDEDYIDKYFRGKLIDVEGMVKVRVYFDQLSQTPGKVRVLRASPDKRTGLYTVALPSPFGTILVNPVNPPVTTIPPLGIPVPDIRIPVNTGTNIDVVSIPDVPGTPAPDDTDFNDYVIIFPVDSGIKPIYIMLSSPRNKPGIASGNGKQVGDKWLEDAGKESGVAIPDRIADKLRGRKFNNFDDFRKQFWEEVSKDPELLNKFSKSNQTLIKKGYAPYPIPEEQVGGRETFELHHDKPISEGGGVYDMDNLRVTTPKRHIDIHRGK